MDCLPITGAILFASCFVIRSFLIFSCCFPFFSPAREGSSTKYMASGKANIAMASVMKLKPDCKSIIPIVNRGALNKAASPTVAIISPSIVISNAFAMRPDPAKAATADNPTTIRAKYSAEWNSNATLTRVGANKTSSIAPMVPPEKEAIAAIVRAFPAFPCCVIGYPSKLVATVEATPGALISIEEVEPPNTAP